MNLLLLYLSKNVPSITTNTILLLLLSFFVELLCLIGTFYHISTLNPSIIRLRILFGDSFSFQLSLFFPFWSCPFGSLFSVHISKRVRITRNAYESLFNRFASISTALLLYRETKRWRISKGHYLSKTFGSSILIRFKKQHSRNQNYGIPEKMSLLWRQNH